MKKVAIVVDSSCGLTQNEVKKLGWYFIPLHIEIDGKVYSDGVDINSQTLFDTFGLNSKEAKTSSSKLGEVIKLLDNLEKEYDNILIYPISHHLSSQYQSLKILERDYTKVRIIKSVNISQLIALDLFEFEQKISAGVEFEEAAKSLEAPMNFPSISLMPKYNEFLVKGGRLSPAAAAIAKLLKIVPIIKFEDGKLIKEGKGRMFTKTVNNIIKKKKEELKHLKTQSEVVLLHSKNQEISIYINEVKKVFGVEPVVMSIPSVVAIHTGPEAVVVIVFKRPTGILSKIKQLSL